MSELNKPPIEERPSKSQRKREMHALQALGKTLVDLPPKYLPKLPLQDDLLAAITAMHSFKSHGAKRRQLQYIGRLMRDIDPKPIEDALLKLKR